MKKFLSWLLVLTMVLSTMVMPVSVFAEETTEGEATEDNTTETLTLTEKVHFNIDFEDYLATNTTFPKADETHGYGTWMNRMSAAGEIIQGEDGNAFKITKAAETGMFNRYKFNTAITTGKVLLSFDMRYNVNGTAGRQTWVFFNNDATVENVYLLSLENPTSTNGPSVGIIKGSHSTNSILFNAAKNDKMYHVDVLFDVDTKTKTFFLDGEQITSHTYSDEALPSVGLTSIKFNLNANIAAIDNFKLIENPKNFKIEAEGRTTEDSYVKVNFSDPMDGLKAADFKVAKADGTGEIAVSRIEKIDGTNYKLILADKLNEGAYAVTLVNSSVKSLFGTTASNANAGFNVIPAITYFDLDFEKPEKFGIESYVTEFDENGSWKVAGSAKVLQNNANAFVNDETCGVYAMHETNSAATRTLEYTFAKPVTTGKLTVSFDAAFDSTINTARTQLLYLNGD